MPTTTTQSTIVAVFRNASNAQAAANELKANGISSGNIFISSENRPSTTSGTAHHEGGITGWFKRIFESEEDEDRSTYESAVKSGNVLLSVDTDDQDVERVADILSRHSPVDIHQDVSGSGAASTGTATKARGSAARTSTTAGRSTATGRGSATRGNGSPVTTLEENGAIPVVQEEVQVGKRRILRGGVRVYTRTVEQPVEETVHLREERVKVERQNVNRPANASDLRRDQEQVVEVEEFAEEPVVSKQARVVEEVRISKEAAERDQKVRDTVRRTEVQVENLGQGSARGTSRSDNLDEDFRRHFTTNYANTGEPYETYGPAYRYGYDMAEDPRYSGTDFSEVEPNLREDYARRYPNSSWDRIKDSVRYGWDKVTGKAKSTTATSR